MDRETFKHELIRSSFCFAMTRRDVGQPVPVASLTRALTTAPGNLDPFDAAKVILGLVAMGVARWTSHQGVLALDEGPSYGDVLAESLALVAKARAAGLRIEDFLGDGTPAAKA